MSSTMNASSISMEVRQIYAKDSLVLEVETEEFYTDFAKDVETKLDTSEYSKDDSRSLPVEKNKKSIAMMKDELAGKIMTEFIALMAKMEG